jgi:glutamate:Na+ symporter, ESS family
LKRLSAAPIEFPNVVTIAFGALTWLIGVFLVRKIPFLERYSIPAPVIGGLLVAILFQAFHSANIPIPKFDTELINSLIIAFFASLGFGASLRVLRSGGKDVIRFLAVCSVLLCIQALAGIGVACMLGEVPLLGALASIVSLVGGPGTALAFSPQFEAAGVESAKTIGLAAAMGGTLLGALLGGPLGTMLITRHKLSSHEKAGKPEVNEEDRSDWLSPENLAGQLVLQNAYLLIVGSAGWYLSRYFSYLGITLPFYIGSMIIACAMRNVDDATGIFKINMPMIDAMGATCLTFFIATMMMTLELWTLAPAAGALLILLGIQAMIVAIASQTIVFYSGGRDYDAAVMSGGSVGFMLGTTATAMSSMRSLVEKYGPAPRAFLVVPVVGACFIDFVNAILISVCLNIFS